MRGDDVLPPWTREVLASVGCAPDQAEALPGGAVNHTYRVRRTDGGDVVLRFAVDPRREDEFPVESWAAQEAARVHIPVALPIVHGVADGTPFIVSEYVAPDPLPVDRPWRWLGEYARRVGSMQLRDAPASLYSRFGADLAAAWTAHVRYGVDALTDDDRLLRDGAYGSPAAMRSWLRPLLDGHYEFGLAHGDLAPRNLVSRGPVQPPVLIDWGAAETGPTPWTDARRVFRWAFVDGSIRHADHDEFAAAAGLGTEADRRTLAAMTALHLLDVCRWALDRRPDLYEEYLEQCRAGLERLQDTAG